MKEPVYYASEELKRAEHLLYVSLKYTRTTDVIKSLVDRLIACFDYLLDGILNHKEEEDIIEKVPKSPFAKIELLKKIYAKDRTMLEYVEFYSLLRKISRTKYTSSRQFRRKVTLTTEINEKKIELNIDIMGDYFYKTLDFLRYVQNYHTLKGK